LQFLYDSITYWRRIGFFGDQVFSAHKFPHGPKLRMTRNTPGEFDAVLQIAGVRIL